MRIVKGLAWLAALLAAAAVGGCGDESSPAPDPHLITNATVEKNDKIDLTCFVSWTTPEPSSSAVEFGEATDGSSASYSFVTEDATLATEHRMLVVGMHASTLVHLRAVSQSPSGMVYSSNDLTYTTGALPEHLTDATLETPATAEAFDGWTVVTLAAGILGTSMLTLQPDTTYPPTGVIFDQQGRVVWYDVHNLSFNGVADYLPDRTLLFASQHVMFQTPTPSALIVDLAGTTQWQGPPQPVNVPVEGIYHHEFRKMPNGHWLTLRATIQNQIVGDVAVELDEAGNEVWTWSSFDHLPPADTTGWSGIGYFDWTHMNALAYDEADDTVLASARNLDAVFKIDRASGDILWQLGHNGDMTMLSSNDTPWFLKAHALERLPDGTLIMLDNGDVTERPWSRVIIYRVDDAAKTAEIVWEYRGATPWAAYYWGDADLLPNGNYFVSAGNWDQGRTSFMFEVTPGEHKVWELDFGTHNGSTIGMYDGARFAPPVRRLTAAP